MGVIVLNVVLLLLAAFAAYGRWQIEPFLASQTQVLAT